MAKCKACDDGSIECGPVESELCRPGGGWEPSGIFAFKLYTRKGASGKCKVKVVPCIPTGRFACTELKCAPATRFPKPGLDLATKATRKKAAKKTAKKTAKKAAKKAAKKGGKATA